MKKTGTRKAREPKWNWEPHIDRLIGLYHTGYSITDIHKRICCEGFNPCQRAVYDKFRELGLSTGHDRGTMNDMRQDTWETTLANTTPLIEGPIDGISTGQASPYTAISTPPASVFSPLAIRQRLPLVSESPPASTSPEMYNMATPSNNVTAMSRLPVRVYGTPSNASPHSKKRYNEQKLAQNHNDTVEDHKRMISRLAAEEKQKIIMRNLQTTGLIDPPHFHSGGRTQRAPQSKKESDYDIYVNKLRRTEVYDSPPLKRLCHRILGRSSAASDNKSDSSTLFSFSTASSGKQSSLFSRLSGRESIITQASSIASSSPLDTLQPGGDVWGITQGQCRILCTRHHEYAQPHEYRETPPCKGCGFGKVHNLAQWASRVPVAYLEVELRLMSKSDIRAVDLAGNSALHYAASAGASVDHLRALINEDIPITQRNSGGQNFLHCLRPATLGISSTRQDGFENDLSNLFTMLTQAAERQDRGHESLKPMLSHQDNHGTTTITALASHITTGHSRSQLFSYYKTLSLGYLINTPNRSGQTAKDVWPPTYRNDTDLASSDTFKTLNNRTPDLDGSPIDRAEASLDGVLLQEPLFVDRVTRDNALHCLARSNTHGCPRTRNIASGIDFYISKGVNPNHHNREGHHPLSAFICYAGTRSEPSPAGPVDETSATTARFLRAVLYRPTVKNGKEELRPGVNIDMLNRRGATALHEASIRGMLECVQLLIAAGANVNARLGDDPVGVSVLGAAHGELDELREAASRGGSGDSVMEGRLRQVLHALKGAGGVVEPGVVEQRGLVGRR